MPGWITGTGLSRRSAHRENYDIQLFDPAVVGLHGLGSLRFGDLVALMDADRVFDRTYLTGTGCYNTSDGRQARRIADS